MTSTAPQAAVIQLRVREKARSTRLAALRRCRAARNVKRSALPEPTVLQRWLDLSA